MDMGISTKEGGDSWQNLKNEVMTQRKPIYILWADSKKAGMKVPAEGVCFEY